LTMSDTDDSGRPSLLGVTAREMADRLAIRQLIDHYAYFADKRDIEGQLGLFTEDTEFLVFMDSRDANPTQEIRGREGLRPAFAELNQYRATTHFNGQSTVTLHENEATGLSYCLAHHVKANGEEHSLMIASIRYLDTFVKKNGLWYFRQRKLMVDWIETRLMT
jgi:ketosteroid isomerase-like protein